MVCAFGQNEIATVLNAAKVGGHVRVGFENNLLSANGNTAASNAVQISDTVDQLQRSAYRVADIGQSWKILGALTQ